MKSKKYIVTSFVVLSLIFSLGAEAKASKAKVSGQLNLNTATAEQIDQLPSISPKKAQAIVDYRKEHAFKSVDELDSVKGFSPKSIDKLKPYLSTEGANTLSVEKSASKGKKQSSGKKKGKVKSS